jgi:hypothetical protein
MISAGVCATPAVETANTATANFKIPFMLTPKSILTFRAAHLIAA